MIKHLLSLSLLILVGCGKPAAPPEADHPAERIISLAPNITHTLQDLGLENRLVGISRFSAGDTESGLPVVGDFMNINYEIIIALKPDLVILEKSSEAQQVRLTHLDIPVLETGSLTLAEILDSIQQIGKVCHAEEQAAELLAKMARQMDNARSTPPHRPRTLIAFSDFSNQSGIEQVYAFGSSCIHSELLAIAGGDNVVRDAHPSVTLSREALLRLNPELIIELSAGGPTNQWTNLSSIDAVRNNNIHVLSGSYTTIPSPGYLMQTLDDFSRIIKQITESP